MNRMKLRLSPLLVVVLGASFALAQPNAPAKKNAPLSAAEKRSLLGLSPVEPLATVHLSARQPYAARPMEAGLVVAGFVDAVHDQFFVHSGGPSTSAVRISAKPGRRYVVDCYVSFADNAQSALIIDYFPRGGTAHPKSVARGEGHVSLLIEPPDDGEATVNLIPRPDPEVTSVVRFRLDYCEVSSRG
jgi:hypothetical protein